MTLAGDERVLDAGCGSGRVTERLLERLPHGRAVALDASPAMIAEARRRLARFGDRVEYLVADLGRPLPIAEPVDAVVSTATFHWVPDHDALFRNLAAVLRPGGELVAQFGGAGNVASVMAVLAGIGDGWLGPAHFETPEATRGGSRQPDSSGSRRGSARSPRRSRPASRSRRSWRPWSSAPISSGCPRPSGPPSSTRSRAACRARRSTTSG